MAEDAAPSLSTERIRAITDEDSMFRAFDDYPWQRDPAFISGLRAILGEPGSQNQQGSLDDMAIHARIFYYSQRIGVNIDFTRYRDWQARNPDQPHPDVIPADYVLNGTAARGNESSPSTHQGGADEATPDSNLPWQRAAPKAELWIDKKKQQTAASAGDQPDYPMAFAEMMRLVQEGKEVPGIRQIPNTVVRSPAVKPVGSRAVPRKPWEKSRTDLQNSNESSTQLDADFPPVEDVV